MGGVVVHRRHRDRVRGRPPRPDHPARARRSPRSARPSPALVLLGLFVFCGAVGFIDDFLKVRKRNSLGLNKRGKLIGQMLVGAVFGVVALYFPSTRRAQTVGSTTLSFVRDIDWLDVGKIGAVIVFIFVVMAMTNGVNLTDGLDGLATGASVMVLGAYALDRVLAVPALVRRPDYAPTRRTATTVRDPLEIAMIAGGGGRRPASASCGGTPRRPGSSWATPARSASAA